MVPCPAAFQDPTSACAFSNTEDVACVVVVCAVVSPTHRSLCAFMVLALQSAASVDVQVDH